MVFNTEDFQYESDRFKLNFEPSYNESIMNFTLSCNYGNSDFIIVSTKFEILSLEKDIPKVFKQKIEEAEGRIIDFLSEQNARKCTCKEKHM